ncbi:peptidoglycan editing factor PgeF [Niallia sp.]|uniref:peptidoglycan editing factor PgeF n=1 Tax=Niallia sp. TaxID=2837523 RepID=UPI00289CB3FE|nr:peptidoglycan editing factor PgeF [Niallia sp.]
MEPFTLRNKQLFNLDLWEQQFPNLIAGFTTKNGGNSKGDYASLNMAFHVNDQKETVIANRKQVAQDLSIPLERWIGAEQTHKVNIEEVTNAQIGMGAKDYESALKDTDGFFTFEKNILLTLCFADCVPLYFIHPATKAIGIAHAGWQGTVKGIAREMMKVFASHNIPAEEILAVIGPSITDRHYIVDDRVINEVEKAVHLKQKPYATVSPGQYSLNLQEINKQILLEAGMMESNIHLTNYCTYQDDAYFFSHRRDKGKTGRMMSYIGWREEEGNENVSER